MSETPSHSAAPGPDRKRVLFLCTANSSRSQMAEGILRHLAGERFECLSAGSKPSGRVHPHAIEMMREIGIDISEHRSKSVEEFLPPEGTPPDVVISLCSPAEAECPAFPGNVERIHFPFDDPAAVEGPEEDQLAAFRRVRDEIREVLEQALSLAEEAT